MKIIFRELNCSVPTIRRFSEFKFIDTALSKEDLTDHRRENMVQEIKEWKWYDQNYYIDNVMTSSLHFNIIIIGSWFLTLYRTCVVTPLPQLRAKREMIHRRQKMVFAKILTLLHIQFSKKIIMVHQMFDILSLLLYNLRKRSCSTSGSDG